MNAYLSAMKNYAVFRGRASRSEFWLFTLATTLVVFVALIIDIALISGPDSKEHIFTGLVVLAHALPSIAVSVRRLHDTDHSGWLVLLNLVPLVGPIMLFVWACQAGTPGANPFGPDPRGGFASPPPGASISGALANGAQARVAPPRDVIAEVERLAQLRANGSLSQAEFEVMKAQALGGGGRA